MGTIDLFDLFNDEEDVHVVKTDLHKVENDKPNEMFEDYYDKKNFSLLWMIVAIAAIIIGFKFKYVKTYIQQNLSLDKAVEYLQGNKSKKSSEIIVDISKALEAYDAKLSDLILGDSYDNIIHSYTTKDITNIIKQEDTYILCYSIDGKEYYTNTDENEILTLFPERTYFKAKFWKIVSEIINRNHPIEQYGKYKEYEYAYYTFINGSCIVSFYKNPIF